MALTQILPEAIPTSAAGAEIAAVQANTTSLLESLSDAAATPALQQAASMGPLSPVIGASIQLFGIALAGVLLYKGVEMVVTGKNSFRKNA